MRMAKTHITTHHDGTITVTPKNEADQSATVVICHGVGDTSKGLAFLASHLSASFPYVKFILPTAPTRKVTMNKNIPMPSWFDIVGQDKLSNEVCNGLAGSRRIITSIVKSEIDMGIRSNRIVLAGFSQGGALSLHTGMQLDGAHRPLAGIVVMSGYLPHASSFKITPGFENTPIFHGHGEKDPTVNLEAALESQSQVRKSGAKDYELKTYPKLPHSVNPQEIEDVGAFLMKVLPPDEASEDR